MFINKFKESFNKKNNAQEESAKQEDHVFQVKNVKVLIQEIDSRPYYDSTWAVVVESPKGIFKCNVVRFDDETFEGLESAIRGLDEITEVSIKTLDKKSCIYYD